MQIQNTMLNLDSYPGTSCLSWWNGGLPLTSGRAQEKTLNSEMGNCNRVTGVDSVSSHSRHDLELSDSNLHRRCTSVQSGDRNSNYVAKIDSQSKPTRSVANTGVLFPHPCIDFCQPFACVPYTSAELYSGRMFHSYGSHAVLNSNVSGLASPRVPLPRQPYDEELIYVNPKQYHGILRRRQLRSKLEAKKTLTQGRKPYLHESRHLHAMRRVRGSGGRFVNTKQLQQHWVPFEL
ncbi:nuclear transcription factor Y subunit A-4-like [Carex rostrata]